MNTLRDPALDAAKASLASLCPGRIVKRGLQDWAALGDTELRRGVFALVADGTGDWANWTGREGQFGKLRFAVVAYGRVDDKASTEDGERLEGLFESEILGWVQAIKPAPIDAVYPTESQYSRGLDHPYAWCVVALEAHFV